MFDVYVCKVRYNFNVRKVTTVLLEEKKYRIVDRGGTSATNWEQIAENLCSHRVQ